MTVPCTPVPRPRFWRHVLRRRHAAHYAARHSAVPCVAPVKGGMAKALARGLLGAGLLTGAGTVAGAASAAWQAMHAPPSTPAPMMWPIDLVQPGASMPTPDQPPTWCGDGCDGDHRPQDVPEPGTLAVFGAALAGIAAARVLRRRGILPKDASREVIGA